MSIVLKYIISIFSGIGLKYVILVLSAVGLKLLILILSAPVIIAYELLRIKLLMKLYANTDYVKRVGEEAAQDAIAYTSAWQAIILFILEMYWITHY